MTSIKGTTFAVEPFNGQNDFTLWQQRVKNILTREGTVKALKKESEKPEKMSDDEWQTLRDMATSTIQMFLADNTLREVISLTDPEEIWTKLETRYKSKSLTNRLYLKKKLYTLKFEEPGDLGKHLDEFNRIATDLTALGEEIKEEDKALLLLASLPDSFDHIVTTLLFGKDTLELDGIVASLLMNETRRKNNGHGSSGSESALAVTGGRKYRSNSPSGSRSLSRSRKDIECWECGKKGHIKRDCYKWKERIEKEKEKAKGKEKADGESSDHSSIAVDSDSDVLLTAEATTGSDEWILDSGCSFHMCAAKEQFSSYKECDRGTVRMANKARSRVAGIGTVQIRMFDGVVRTLTDVRHVPDLRMNLISLGTLDFKGFKISAEGGVIKVSKGPTDVMKGQKTGSLYRLLGSVQTGGAPVRPLKTQVQR